MESSIAALQKIKISWAKWHKPAILVIQWADVGRLLEFTSSRLAWAT
jgi:hypothetical protein